MKIYNLFLQDKFLRLIAVEFNTSIIYDISLMNSRVLKNKKGMYEIKNCHTRKK